MNTFLPYASFMKSARCLDDQNLRRQRLEALQLVEACLRETQPTDPIVRLWKGFEIALCHYGMCCCYEWKERGHSDNLYNQFQEKLKGLPTRRYYDPPWLGQERLHLAWQTELLKLNHEWYTQFGWDKEPTALLTCLKGS